MPVVRDTDAQLVARACSDPDALAELYLRYRAQLYAWFRARVPEAAASELTAELFAQVALGVRRFRDEAGGSAAPWLYGIAKNLLWTILHRGDVDHGRGAYVHAVDKATGGHSVFMVEHDAGLDRYDAFLLHERVVDRGNAAEAESGIATRTETGPLCTRAELTHAEAVALATLRASFAPGTPAEATRAPVADAVASAFAAAPCRGLEYAGEQARLVYAGTQPSSMLIPGAR